MFRLSNQNQRTLKHGDLMIVAIRPNQVRIGNSVYSTADARKIASELPPDLANDGMAAKLMEQADWADGKDL